VRGEGFANDCSIIVDCAERRPIAAAGDAVDKQASKRPQALIRIVEAFRDLKGAYWEK
jgi:hypothetical protein